MSLHIYAPAALVAFLADLRQSSYLEVSIGKARSSHSAHLVVRKRFLTAVRELAERKGLSCELGRSYRTGDKCQLVVRAPISDWS